MSTASTLALFARLIFSLGVVIGLMWVAARVRAQARLRRRRRREPAARACRSTCSPGAPLGRNASIAVVRVGEQAMVVGVTDHQITKLADADLDEIDLETRRATGRRLRKGRTARLRHGRRCSTNCGTAPPVAERHRARQGLRDRSVRNREPDSGTGRSPASSAGCARASSSSRRSLDRRGSRAGRRSAPLTAAGASPRPPITAPSITTPAVDADHADAPSAVATTAATPARSRSTSATSAAPTARTRTEARPERRHHPVAHGARDRAGADGDAHELHAHRDRAVAHAQRARPHRRSRRTRS